MRYLRGLDQAGLVAGAILIVAVVAFSACDSAPTATRPDPRGSGAAGYPPIPGKVAIYLSRPPTTAVAGGRAIRIRVVIVNDLGHSFEVPDTCNGWLQTGLATPTIPFEPFTTSMVCASFTVHPGITKVARTVATTYEQCSQEDPAAIVTASEPRCTGPLHNGVPPLPPGSYRFELGTAGIPHAVVRSRALLTLTRAPSPPVAG